MQAATVDHSKRLTLRRVKCRTCGEEDALVIFKLPEERIHESSHKNRKVAVFKALLIAAIAVFYMSANSMTSAHWPNGKSGNVFLLHNDSIEAVLGQVASNGADTNVILADACATPLKAKPGEQKRVRFLDRLTIRALELPLKHGGDNGIEETREDVSMQRRLLHQTAASSGDSVICTHHLKTLCERTTPLLPYCVLNLVNSTLASAHAGSASTQNTFNYVGVLLPRVQPVPGSSMGISVENSPFLKLSETSDGAPTERIVWRFRQMYIYSDYTDDTKNDTDNSRHEKTLPKNWPEHRWQLRVEGEQAYLLQLIIDEMRTLGYRAETP